eukprot:7105580-Heterocapsa_arctica.AAC.1
MLARGPDPWIRADWERTFQTRIRELYTHEGMVRGKFLSDLEAASIRGLADVSREVNEASERNEASG